MGKSKSLVIDSRYLEEKLKEKFPKKKPVTLSLNEHWYLKLQEHCKGQEYSASDVIDELITQFLTR